MADPVCAVTGVKVSVQPGALPPLMMLAFGRRVVLEEVAETKLVQFTALSTSLTDKVTAREVFSVIDCAEIAPKTGASLTGVIVNDAREELEVRPLAVTV